MCQLIARRVAYPEIFKDENKFRSMNAGSEIQSEIKVWWARPD
jgi:hypothetical protein